MDVRNATLVCWMLFGLCHSCFVGRAQDGLVISEFMAINSDTIRDDFGDSSDYVEIYNGTADAINLDGYYLTDSLSRKTQWQFPSIRIDSGSYLLVWASGRDRRAAGEPLHANFKLDGAGEALALVLPDQTTVVHQYVFGAQALDRECSGCGRAISRSPNPRPKSMSAGRSRKGAAWSAAAKAGWRCSAAAWFTRA